ncbi:DeoR/GlpR family DNA-binding transcription regulator [Staphylococcus agnetis]|uniref:DeoR/GlpR family DNA-binding transcription regulator n=1 Tax=Staphylococcus agnetis TaxID=985762 RepID=UPI000CD124AF|nr:DeoR/GlpR family DNA-binding transcription regulator [Staphylococcus agnetis]MBY7664356.1 DeoR/GlpR family DNA-binding transcription regulator [Staphylococcus agnetis]NJH68817.1 DeoR family transcriptional regulator [Staphylococcus agnetis]NJH79251.1 DeoR family transcriptional regulator [Staphylococcus agnetis]PNY84664.1 DeoR/GlpR transcriptional regulator [Staphylococcus agnetis]PTH66149.1 DeoR/GlpR transcriptional regulator [Staphylococcus agnetis]
MKAKRIFEIEAYINQQKAVTLEELCVHFDVSLNTIRRDINELTKLNRVKKVYGGVETLDPTLPSAVDYTDRNIENAASKKAIGRLAAKLIQPHDIIYIDTGTTTIHILDHVDKNLPFTIITNSLDVINKASHFNHVELFIIGEQYKKTTRSFIGLETNVLLKKFNIQKAFMAATGVNINNGLSNSEIEENHIKQIIMSKTAEAYVCVDHSKMNKSTLLTYAPLNAIHTIITNQALPHNLQHYASEHHIDVVY